jgi:hypothetical protein
VFQHWYDGNILPLSIVINFGYKWEGEHLKQVIKFSILLDSPFEHQVLTLFSAPPHLISRRKHLTI